MSIVSCEAWVYVDRWVCILSNYTQSAEFTTIGGLRVKNQANIISKTAGPSCCNGVEGVICFICEAASRVKNLKRCESLYTPVSLHLQDAFSATLILNDLTLLRKTSHQKSWGYMLYSSGLFQFHLTNAPMIYQNILFHWYVFIYHNWRFWFKSNKFVFRNWTLTLIWTPDHTVSYIVNLTCIYERMHLWCYLTVCGT